MIAIALLAPLLLSNALPGCTRPAPESPARAPTRRSSAPARTLARRLARRFAIAAAFALALAALFFSMPSAQAADEAPVRVDGALAEQVRALALSSSPPPASARAGDGAPRVEVVVGQLDTHLRLAPCDRVEPYLPSNVRLWGKSRIGLKCTQGRTPWNVYLPITVKVFGRALVLPAGASAGSVVGDADLVEGEVDLAEEPTPAIVDRQLAVGRTLAQNLRPGQAIRQGHLKLRQWFAAGETVKVVAVGAGFALESEAQALTNGIEGQSARVRTESGRILTGQTAGERRLEVAL